MSPCSGAALLALCTQTPWPLPQEVSYSSAINACSDAWEVAIELLKAMAEACPRTEVIPSGISDLPVSFRCRSLETGHGD